MKQKALTLLKRSLNHELISGSFYTFLGSFTGNFLAFLFNFFLVHNLKSADYGEYASLVSLVNLISIPSSSFVTIIVQFATDYLSKKEIGKALQLYNTLFRFTTGLGVMICIFFLIFNLQLQSFFHISNIWILLIAGLSIAVSYMGIVNNAFTTSLLRFGFLSLLLIMAGAIKLGGAFTMFSLGYSVMGAMTIVFLSVLFPFLTNFIPVKAMFKEQKQRINIHLGDLIRYAIPTTVVTLALSSFTSSDVLLAKHFFRPQEAGQYAGLALIGKVIFYFTGSIPMVMFPLIIKRYNLKQNFQNLLYLSLLIILIPALGLAGFYYLFPVFTIKIFLGNAYLSLRPYLVLMALYMAIYSVLNLLVTFFLSLKKTTITWVVALGGIIQIWGIYTYHASFMQIIIVNIATAVVLLVILLVYYIKTYGIRT